MNYSTYKSSRESIRPDANMRCRICGANKFGHLFSVADIRFRTSETNFDIFKCTSCAVYITTHNGKYVDPYKYYPPQYGAYRQKKSNYSLNRIQAKKNQLLSRIAPHVALNRMVWTNKIRINAGSRILDVGCGTGKTGTFLRGAFNATHIVGIEPEAAAAQAARDNGLKVYTSKLGDIDLAETFHIVLLIHVLEHLPDPLGGLRFIHTQMKPGGKMIVAIPNIDSFERKLFGIFWDGWDVPRHIHHFSRKSLSYLLQRAGFRIENYSFEAHSVLLRSLGNKLFASRPYHLRTKHRFGYAEKALGLLLAMLKTSSAIQTVATRT